MSTESAAAAPVAVEAEFAGIVPACPCCGSTVFRDVKNRGKVQCVKCRSMERTRVAQMLMDKHIQPKPDWKVLHLAPERALAYKLMELCGDNYDPRDYDHERYARVLKRDVQHIDLSKPNTLPKGEYDLVIHNHVLEHIPANWTIVLQSLHAALKPGGTHLFSVPIASGYFREDLDPNMSDEERTQRFLQFQHVRIFGVEDFDRTIGAVLNIPSKYNLLSFFTPAELFAANIPRVRWRKVNGASVFMTRA